MSPNSRIRVLPPLLVNKIAAGEVVERPASVVKELLDNAIDAGANRIAVTIEDGGKQLIRITDDGCGMSPNDLELCVSPHATSKVIEERDLYAIASLGFRGEALASISSVSKLRVVSRPSGQDAAHEITVSGADRHKPQAAGGPVGTTVEVRDLFFNVPARRKFLRSKGTEVGHINEQISRAALAFPHITFELTNNGRKTLILPACERRVERIRKFYGPELAESLLVAERTERGITMEAYLAPPARSRATAQWQYTFVNARYIRDRFVQHAIKEAFRGLIEHSRHAIVFLFITLDPKMVDINVHPTKIEVRWAEPNLIHSQSLALMRETLQQADLAPALRTDRAARDPLSPDAQSRMREELATMLKATSPIQPNRGEGGGAQGTWHDSPSLPGRSAPSMDPMETWRALYGEPTRSRDETTPPSTAPTSAPMDRLAAEPHLASQPPRAVQMHNLYLVAETEDGIVIIDQHALHERVMYEQLKDKLTRGPLESQRLLLPEMIPVTSREMDLLTEKKALLDRLGIEVAPFAKDSMAVHAFPALLKDANIGGFLRDLIDYLTDAPDATPEVMIHKVLDMMACKAAVKAGDTLTQQEIETLISKRDLVEKSSNCPHGRPTTLRLTKADLNRQFKRT
ncbi:MAG: DNA mismatch repair endonuclease MutL [Phycisphaerae bacterium]